MPQLVKVRVRVRVRVRVGVRIRTEWVEDATIGGLVGGWGELNGLEEREDGGRIAWREADVKVLEGRELTVPLCREEVGRLLRV